jgi:hypothetical protein
LRLRGRGGQNHFSFAPSIQEACGLESTCSKQWVTEMAVDLQYH